MRLKCVEPLNLRTSGQNPGGSCKIATRIWTERSDVCFWHKADIDEPDHHVRFWG